MRSIQSATNAGLAALIEGARFPSMESFALAVNRRAWQRLGVRLRYDHVSVKRWLRGGSCQYPEILADVLSDAWGVPIPEAVVFPALHTGTGLVPAHLQAWVAVRTLEDLGIFLRSDMLTRREILTEAIGAVSGPALIDPLARWLGIPSVGVPDIREASGRIGMSTVAALERSIRYLGSVDAEAGGGLSREAAVGQLRYAVDLARHATYSADVGRDLLGTIADLSGLVGWMSHDVDMDGPAQRYFVYGLQAAHESGDGLRLRAAGILADMATQMRALGHPDTGLRLVDLALDRVPVDRRRFNTVRGMLWCLKARMLASMGPGYRAEVRSAIDLSFELFGTARDDEPDPAVARYWPYTSEAELASVAAASYRDLAHTDPRFARTSERYAQQALVSRQQGFKRSLVLDQIALARARFLAGEPDQAGRDGEQAVEMALAVVASHRVAVQIRELATESEPYRDRPAVREFRERLRTAVS